MKTSELRIGNYILYNGVKITVSGIFGNTIRYDDSKYHDSNSMGYEPYQPIPLTKEWLLKFGFNKRYKAFAKGDFTFIENSGMAYKLSIVDNMPKYVHQLQNLYFAMTGEELTLNDMP